MRKINKYALPEEDRMIITLITDKMAPKEVAERLNKKFGAGLWAAKRVTNRVAKLRQQGYNIPKVRAVRKKRKEGYSVNMKTSILCDTDVHWDGFLAQVWLSRTWR